MTKREFDAETKLNLGPLFGQRTEYRARRGRVAGRRDYVMLRAGSMSAWNEAPSSPQRGMTTLGQGSRFRTLAKYRAERGLPLLEE